MKALAISLLNIDPEARVCELQHESRAERVFVRLSVRGHVRDGIRKLPSFKFGPLPVTVCGLC